MDIYGKSVMNSRDGH